MVKEAFIFYFGFLNGSLGLTSHPLETINVNKIIHFLAGEVIPWLGLVDASLLSSTWPLSNWYLVLWSV